MIFREMISCHRASAKIILDNAYSAIGEPPAHTITDESILIESANLEVADYIFSAHPLVDSSLIENGVPATKILEASYGWDPARFSGRGRLLQRTDGITAVFVGSVSVGKGVHLLLEYWAESKIEGRLILAGLIEPLIRKKYSQYLARDDVVELGYVKDIGALFRSADVFLFPSLVEGGPQVTYEALACGVPIITSPMGAGRVARHDIEGYVVEPYDRAGWVDAIQLLAKDSTQRKKFSEAARERAQEFTWNAVAARRRQQVMDCVAGHR
jgi:glycosyltransferase involved in cell wall biosynthesis